MLRNCLHLFTPILKTLLACGFVCGMIEGISAQPLVLYECDLDDYQQVPNPHAIWLDIPPGNVKYVFDSQGGTIKFFDDSTVQITGRVVNVAQSNRQWDVDMWLFNPLDYPAWTSAGGLVKADIVPQSVINANVADWIFWELDSTRSVLTGVPGSAFDGDTLNITHRPADLTYGFQLGIGGNARNDNFGLGGWFFYSGSYTGIGDLNVDMHCDTPSCDVMIDTAFTQCIDDSTFEMVVTFSGTGVAYEISDNLGTTPLFGVTAGTYTFGSYSNNTPVQVYVTDLVLPSCADSIGPITTDCTPPPPPCDVQIDTLYAQCVDDSTFEILVMFTGSSTSYMLSDNQGTPVLSGITPGTYVFGSYANNTNVSVVVSDLLNPAVCADSAGTVTEDCTPPPPPCDVQIDTLYAQCVDDSTFEVVVAFTGSGTSYSLGDNQGTIALSGITPGTYVFGSYANNTDVSVVVSDLLNPATCADSAGTVTEDCTPPPPPCDVQIDSIYTQCVDDSTFEVVVTFTGTGSDFELSDNQGSTPIGGLSAGTYTYGSYSNNTSVIVFVNNTILTACGDMAGPVSADCAPPPPPCQVSIDTVIVSCVSDSTFEVLVSFSGIGNNFQLKDDQGMIPMSNLSPGTYSIGPYFNSTDVTVTVEDTSVNGCMDVFGPITEDCTPVPVCDLDVDPLQTICLSDSTFALIVSFSGTGGTDYNIYDDFGTDTLFNVSPGTYQYGEYPNNTLVSVTVDFINLFSCIETVGPITDDCSLPPPPCSVGIDSAVAVCLTDSTFQILVGFTGTGNNFVLSDDQGSPIQTGLASGVYVLGPYSNNTNVTVTVSDPDSLSCSDSFGPLTEDCSIPVVCEVNIDTLFAQCISDSTFEIVVDFSGTATNHNIADNLGLYVLTGVLPGTYSLGPYDNMTQVSVIVDEALTPSCFDTAGPVSADCTPPPCTISIDTAYTICLTDSTFTIAVEYSGSGTNLELSDDQGTPPVSGLSSGSLSYGTYPNNTMVNLTLVDLDDASCEDTFGPLTADCSPVITCAASMDTIYALCLTDSSFVVVVEFSGIGNNFILSDDQGTTPLTNLSPGMHSIGPYFNSTDVVITVADTNFMNCGFSFGPVTADCTPVPICDVVIDDINPQCISDSTFNMVITISGSGDDYSIMDNVSTYQLNGVGPGTYSLGPYATGTSVGALVIDNRVFGCIISGGPVVGNCSVPTNDECLDAEWIVCDSTIYGSTLNATSSNPPGCGTIPSGNGVWYKLKGDGSTITLSTCSTPNPVDTEINVYKGKCDLFKCITGNDNGFLCNNGASEVSFVSAPSTTYYVYVSDGPNSSGGDFELRMSCHSRTTTPTVFPNPTKDKINLRIPSEDEKYIKWMIVNLQGIVLMSGNETIDNGFNDLAIDLKNLRPGIVFLHLNIPFEPSTIQKIIIEE